MILQTQSACTSCNVSYKSENYRKLQAYSIHFVQVMSECRLKCFQFMVDLLCMYTNSTTCEAEATQHFSKSTGPTAQTSDNSAMLSKESNCVMARVCP